MQNLANQLPCAFIDTKKVTKSHISAMNALAQIDVPEGQLVNEFKMRLKCERPIGSKDITPQKRRTRRRIDTPEEVHGKRKDPIKAYEEQKAPTKAYGEQEALVKAYNEQKTPEVIQNKEIAPKEAQVLENYEISINCVHNREK